MNWHKTIDRIEREASAVLTRSGIPKSRKDLLSWLKSNQPNDHLAFYAILVVSGCYYLRLDVEKGRTDHALDRLLDVVAAHDEMTILRDVPSYEKRREPVSRVYTKDMALGAARRKGGDRGRENRPIKATPEQARAMIDAVWSENQRQGITVIREEAGRRLGLSQSQVGRITEYYNPKKRS